MVDMIAMSEPVASEIREARCSNFAAIRIPAVVMIA
jgi:hypothetical protein